MMAQTYPGSGDFDAFYHTPVSNRSMSDHRYDHSVPYNHHPYHYRRDHRSEYPGRHSTRTLIHEPVVAGPNEQAPRKRIGVACTRCRKRKIKCSGDVGDGSGCAACKQQGNEGALCTFNRVGTSMIPEYEEFLANSQPPITHDTSYSLDPTSGALHATTPYQTLNHHQSLPILHTRGTYPESYESYSASPVDGYPYSSYSFPRNDSLSTAHENNFRSWNDAAIPPSAPATNAYDQSPSYTFGSICAQSFSNGHPAQQQKQPPQQQLLQPPQQHSTRLSSVTPDTLSALNMGHLYTSLPTQTVQNRRLPIPNTTSSCEGPTYPGPELPEIRPLTAPKNRLNSAHSRIAAPWRSNGGYSNPRSTTTATIASPNGMSLQPAQTTSMVQQPAVGYHYNAGEAQMTTSQSLSTSPAMASSSSSTVTYAGGPPESKSMTPISYGAYYGLPPITTAQLHDSRGEMNLPPPTSSYSFDSDATTTTTNSSSSSDGGHPTVQGTMYSSYPTIRHPRPHHAASMAALRRPTSFDQQQQQQQQQNRSGMREVHRISVEGLSGGAGSECSGS